MMAITTKSSTKVKPPVRFMILPRELPFRRIAPNENHDVRSEGCQLLLLSDRLFEPHVTKDLLNGRIQCDPHELGDSQRHTKKATDCAVCPAFGRESPKLFSACTIRAYLIPMH